MKMWNLSLLLVAVFALSCGQRNAAGVPGGGTPGGQKPTGNASFIAITGALVLSDYQVRLTFDEFENESAMISSQIQVFIDEKKHSLQAFTDSNPVLFGELTCLQEVAGVCRDYNVGSHFGSIYRIHHLEDMQVIVRSASGEKSLVYPLISISEKTANGGTAEYIATRLPDDPVVYWMQYSLLLPQLNGASPLNFGMTGTLKEPLSFYEFEALSQTQYSPTASTFEGFFKHLLTGQEEVIEWEFRRN